jgi:hypothetical protein
MEWIALREAGRSGCLAGILIPGEDWIDRVIDLGRRTRAFRTDEHGA